MIKSKKNLFIIPLNIKFEWEKFTTGYIIWFSSFITSSKLFFLVPYLLRVKTNNNVLIFLEKYVYKRYYFNKLIKSNFIRNSARERFFSLLRQAVISVLIGYKKIITLKGVGYKFSIQNDLLLLEVGQSHKTAFLWDRTFEKSKFSRKSKGFLVKHYHISTLTSFLAKIKLLRPLNLYTRKGAKYRGEVVKYKEKPKRKNL